MSDPKVIYLGPECEDEFCDGRTWADHVAWPDCDCKHNPVRYNIGSDYDAALAREAALREELGKVCGDEWRKDKRKIQALQQRLTDAEKRAGELEGLLREVANLDPRGEFLGWQLDGKIDAALKPAEEAAGSTCNQIREESGLPTKNPCVACNNGACIDR